MVRSGDGDRVYLPVLKDFTKVLNIHRSIAQLLLCDACECGHNAAIHIANVRDTSGIAILYERSKMSIASDMQTKDCKVETIVGTHNLTVAFGSG
jgi:hypothetical protein